MTVPDTFHGLLAALSNNPVFLATVCYLALGYAYSVLPALTSQVKAAGSAILPLALASLAYVTGAALSYWAWGIEPFYQVVLVAFSAGLGAKLIHSGAERLTGHAAGLVTLIGQQINGQTGGTQFTAPATVEGALVGGNVGTQTTNTAETTSRIVLQPLPEPEPAPVPVLPPVPVAPAPQFSVGEIEAWVTAHRAAETDRIAASERGEGT